MNDSKFPKTAHLMAFSVAAGERELRFIPVESVKAPPKPNIVWYLGKVLMRIEPDPAGDTVRCSERRNSEPNLKRLHIIYVLMYLLVKLSSLITYSLFSDSETLLSQQVYSE